MKWGILGTGGIADKFVCDLKLLSDAEVVAVGSRSDESAKIFAAKHGIAKAYGSYFALAKDVEIDVIYIATLNHLHLENTIMCLEEGKPALCEKPFAINKFQAEKIIAVARKSRLFLMEAMWTRFLPAIVKVRELLAENVIGNIKHVAANFCLRVKPEKTRCFNPNFGGGALLDLGIYPVSFLSMIFKKQPLKISGSCLFTSTGVDETGSAIFTYGNNQIATFTCSIAERALNDVFIYGSKGYIHIPDFWSARTIELFLDSSQTQTFRLETQGFGYGYQALEVARCLKSGLLESDVMPLDETLSVMNTMDNIRKQWGLVLPQDIMK